MSNHPNMSYCQFENTSNALDQCMATVEEAIENGELLDLNQYEQRPFREMYSKLESFLALLDRYEEMKEELESEEEKEEEEVQDDA